MFKKAVSQWKKKKTPLELKNYGKKLPSIQTPVEKARAARHKEQSPNAFSETYRRRYRNPSGTIDMGDVGDFPMLDDASMAQQPGQPRLHEQRGQQGQEQEQMKGGREGTSRGSREHGTLPSYSAASGPGWKSDTAHSKTAKGRGRRGIDPTRGEVPLPSEESPSLVSGLTRQQEQKQGERHAVHTHGDMAREGVSSAEAASPPVLRTGAKTGVRTGRHVPGRGENRDATGRSARDAHGARGTDSQRGPPLQRIYASAPGGHSASHYADSPMHTIGARASDFDTGSYDDVQFREPSYLSDGMATSADMPQDSASDYSEYAPGYPGLSPFQGFPSSPGLATGTSSQAAGQESSAPPAPGSIPPGKGKHLKEWDNWIPSPQASDHRHIKTFKGPADKKREDQATGDLQMEKTMKKSSRRTKRVVDAGSVLSQEYAPNKSSPLARN